MTWFLCALLIVVVALAIAWPLVGGPRELAKSKAAGSDLERHKRAAMLAIRETEFDQAMGKLSAEDARRLTSSYEARALEAMAGLGQNDGTASGPVTATAARTRAAYCAGCGASFEEDHSARFCPACGRQR